jgi:hypothetical protein
MLAARPGTGYIGQSPSMVWHEEVPGFPSAVIISPPREVQGKSKGNHSGRRNQGDQKGIDLKRQLPRITAVRRSRLGY